MMIRGNAMSTNLSRYEADLGNLVEKGRVLLTAMQYEQHPQEVREQLKGALGDKLDEFIKKSHSFPRNIRIGIRSQKR
jgi:hypothetical protein